MAKTACVIIIGNEILSGRTQDVNLNWLAAQLSAKGIRLMESRVIPDLENVIVDTVNACRKPFDYIFTTGGIGPTHDDITSVCIARAFGVKLLRHKEAEDILIKHYGVGNLNAARLKMADIPEGAVLIPNPISAAPGFRIENVYVLAGVPAIMRAMFEHLRRELEEGPPIISKSVTVFLAEGVVAHALSNIQNRHPQIDIGSYPFVKQTRLGTSLVARGSDAREVDKTYAELMDMVKSLGGEITDEP